MRHLMLTLCCCAAFAACGSDKKTAATTEGTASDGSGATPLSALALNASKMAQQATASSQSQADQSETASSGSDDNSGTADSANGTPSLAKGRGGELGIRPQPGVDFNQVVAIDFNVSLDFNAYVGPNQATANGNVNVAIRHGSNGNSNITLQGTIEETDSKGHHLRQSTEPNITVAKEGSRKGGKVVRELRGIIRRTLTADTAAASFDLLIDHTDTIVTDLYANSSLTNRTISGSASVTDADSGDSAVLTFTNLTRSSPKVCLCPTGGSISAAYTHAGTTKTIDHTFSTTCGEVTVEEHLTAAASAKATDTAAATTTTAAQGLTTSSDGTSVSSGIQTSVSAKVVWANCIPG